MRYLLLVLALLAACTYSGAIRMYPVNDNAAEIGVLKAQYTDYRRGQGSMTVELPSGEILTGEVTTLSSPSTSFGVIYGRAFNTSLSAITPVVNKPNSSPGIASLIGDRGSRMHCEYIRAANGHGGGGCELSDGSVFKIHF